MQWVEDPFWAIEALHRQSHVLKSNVDEQALGSRIIYDRNANDNADETDLDIEESP